MKITILMEIPPPSPFDIILAWLSAALQAENHSLTQFDLRDLSLRYCIGCWGLLVKTPGSAPMGMQPASLWIGPLSRRLRPMGRSGSKWLPIQVY